MSVASINTALLKVAKREFRLTWKPPAQPNPLVIIDFNPPTEFRGGFAGTTGRVYYPSDAADVSWIPGTFTKVSYNPAAPPSNGRFDLATDAVYVFAAMNSFQAGSGYAWKTYRINSDTAGSALKDVLVLPHLTDPLPHEFAVTGGRNIKIIGGEFQGSLPTAYTAEYPSGPLNTSVSVLRFANVAESVYMEGVKVDVKGMFGLDAIQPGPVTIVGPNFYPVYRPDYYCQNVLTVGLKSDVNTGLHSDGFQPNGPVGDVYMDRYVCESEYQGLFLAQQGLIDNYILKNTWCRYPANNNRIGAYNFFLLTDANEATADSSGGTNINGNARVGCVQMDRVYAAVNGATTQMIGDVAVPTSSTVVGTVTGAANGDAFTIRTQNPANSPVSITLNTLMTGDDLIFALDAVTGINASRQAVTNFMVLDSTDGYPIELINTSGNFIQDFFETTFTSLPADWGSFAIWPRTSDTWAGSTLIDGGNGMIYTKLPFSGKVRKGSPPVRLMDETKIGIGYVSPGYMDGSS